MIIITLSKSTFSKEWKKNILEEEIDYKLQPSHKTKLKTDYVKVS